MNDTPNDSNISVGDKKITILDAALLKDGASISATNDYTIKLSSSLEPSDEISKGWNGNSYYSTDGYKAAGWILSGSKVSKVNTLTPAVTVSSIKSNSSFNMNDKTVIVSSFSLNKKTVTINGTGYTHSCRQQNYLQQKKLQVLPNLYWTGWLKILPSLFP